jgi:hypothetical protein
MAQRNENTGKNVTRGRSTSSRYSMVSSGNALERRPVGLRLTESYGGQLPNNKRFVACSGDQNPKP